MKIVVTGGAGFIGSHLVDRLLKDDWGEIVVLDNLRRGSLQNLATHWRDSRLSFRQVDIRNYRELAAQVEGCDVLFHLAAQSNVMGAVNDVDYSFETNVVGTFNVLKAAHEHRVKRVVFTSSREAYGEALYLPVDEEHPLGSKNTYGASKAAGEMYCRVYYNTFGVETAVLRLANVYGARDFGRVIPLWLERAQAGKDLVVYGGEQLIDFIAVDFVIDALLQAAQAPSRVIIGRPINIGSGKGTPILALAERIRLLFAHKGVQLDFQPARAVEVVRFVADTQKMLTALTLTPPNDPLKHLEELIQPEVA